MLKTVIKNSTEAKKSRVFLKHELTSSAILRHSKDSHFAFKIWGIIIVIFNFEY